MTVLRRTPSLMPMSDRCVRVEGTVQGVGFRPYVARLAARCALRGWVRNDGRGVLIRVAGPAAAVDAFIEQLPREAPPAARIECVTSRDEAECGSAPDATFTILDSDIRTPPQPSTLTPDLALCGECRRDLNRPGDRRRDYPFITCATCGPRYSIVESLPYDRPRTTMAAFAMCPSCAREYADPADRRYHAQAIACPACGPHVDLLDATGATRATRGEAIAAAAAALRAGLIVAVKGIGGFHLLCDAANEQAVLELRRRKHRDEKPLAVMFPDLESLRQLADVNDDEAASLTSPAAPIVLVRRKPGMALAPAIAPGNPCMGALLPYSPLHVLLLEMVGRPLVATSGNDAGEPLCHDNEQARARLGAIADLFLVHDRPIARPVDDSVLRPSAAGTIILRRARGYAPAALRLPDDAAVAAPVLCVGAHMKNTVAVASGSHVVVSPHLGDLENAASRAAFRRAIELLQSLHGRPFTRVACDLHPAYASTQFAEALGLPIVRVQHHLAHVLACVLDQEHRPDRVLGVAWDGTGFGSDGTVWGGEFIVLDTVARTARRVASLRSFRLPGGEAAVREPRRSALGVLQELAVPADEWERHARQAGFNASDCSVLHTLLKRGCNAPLTTSAGRLFDAAASLLGFRHRCSFEGQAAMELEFAAEPPPSIPWSLPVVPTGAHGRLELDWRPLMAELWRRHTSEEPSALAARFHATLAGGIVATAAAVGIDAVALCGGCFQNARLLETTSRGLELAGFRVLRHRNLPPNDGAIAAGQALAVGWGISSVSE